MLLKICISEFIIFATKNQHNAEKYALRATVIVMRIFFFPFGLSEETELDFPKNHEIKISSINDFKCIHTVRR